MRYVDSVSSPVAAFQLDAQRYETLTFWATRHWLPTSNPDAAGRSLAAAWQP